MKATPSASEEERPRYTSCWACHIKVEVPKIDGRWADEFKVIPSSTKWRNTDIDATQCGWCGAVTDMRPISSRGKHGLLLSSNAGKTYRRCLHLLACSGQVLIVVFVVSLLLSIMIVGFFALLPNLYRDPSTLFWNQLITVFLSFNIICNYTMALVKGSKSRNTSLPSTEGTDIPKGIYDNYRYCVPCQSVKAPDSHHCSACNACIEQMDHHCPFIGNCVGRRNLHNFLLFLFWTAVGAIYAMIVCVLVVFDNWPSISRKRRRAPSFLKLGLSSNGTSPWWIFAAFYMFVVCFVGTVGVLVMLTTQLEQIRRGQTYVESLKIGARPLTKSEGIFTRLAHVLGGKNPLFWLFPCFLRGQKYERVDTKLR